VSDNTTRGSEEGDAATQSCSSSTLETLKVAGRVTGVGNEAYFLAVVPDHRL
jgi:hypothetical protein